MCELLFVGEQLKNGDTAKLEVVCNIFNIHHLVLV